MKIDDLIGKPYQKEARGPDAFDCFGLFAELCRRRGDSIPPEVSPERVEDRAAAIAAAIERGEWRQLDAPEPGCAVVMRIIPPFVSHLGMVLDGGRFIHTREGMNVAIERLSSVVWRSRIAGFYTHSSPFNTTLTDSSHV
jgi:cell wall-associated NlpC family hydrolase